MMLPPPPGEIAWVDEQQEPDRDVRIVSADPSWACAYATLAERIIAALGDDALRIEHVGSTSVPGLAAKPVIDIDLTVEDPGNEQAYVPALEQHGFVLVSREPWWSSTGAYGTTVRPAICTSSRQTVPKLHVTASFEIGCAPTLKTARSTRRPR